MWKNERDTNIDAHTHTNHIHRREMLKRVLDVMLARSRYKKSDTHIIHENPHIRLNFSKTRIAQLNIK